MKKLCPAVLFSFMFAPVLFAQTLRSPAAVSYTGFGAYSNLHADIFSFIANQASLARLENAAAGVYAERKFFLNDLHHFLFMAGMTAGSGQIGLKTSYAGSKWYNETQIGLAYARGLGPKAGLGIQFNYNGISIAGYGNASAITAELGLLLHLTTKLNAGIQVNNPAGGKFANNQAEKLPAIYTAGFGYEASEKFFISTEIRKEEKQPVTVNAGFQYKFIPLLWVRAGIESAASVAWLGLVCRLKSFRVDFTASYHPQLGLTPGLLILVEFPKKNSP